MVNEPGNGSAGEAEEEREQSLLSRISNEMVKAMKQYYGKGPTKAKSYIVDDLLSVVFLGGILPSERTMLDAGKEDAVRAFRQEFENEMTERLIGTVEELTGRKVLTYQSQILFEPDLVIEIFVFDQPAPEEQARDTARGQLEDHSVGEATNAPTED